MNKYQCTISQLPGHVGDSYGWGSDVILTIDIRESDFTKPLISLNLGTTAMGDNEPLRLARIIQAALHNYHETPDNRR